LPSPQAVYRAGTHSCGVIHCDLKPSNLLLKRDGHVVVVDFGVAFRANESLVGVRFAGTPAFMAPEQVLFPGDGVSIRTDIYGLGATLYTLLAGRPPYIGTRGERGAGPNRFVRRATSDHDDSASIATTRRRGLHEMSCKKIPRSVSLPRAS
jgi:serine/threonine protein kinase